MFDEKELENLKIIIRRFTEGSIQAKELKQTLLRCRGRIVEDISSFLTFCIDRVQESNQPSNHRESTDSNQLTLANEHLKIEISEKNELLKIVAERINSMLNDVRS